MKAKKIQIPVWDAAQLGIKENEVGLPGSYTQVIKIFTPDIKHDIKILEGSTEEKVEQLYKELKNLSVV
jgi:electron transfer flavoprotein beta subunit